MSGIEFAASLQSAAETLLDRRATPQALRMRCAAVFEACAALSGALDEQPSALACGKALSALEAARCLLDYPRTTVLLRAVDAAIRARLQQQPGPICLLYVGCGPFATLILPLLARYPAERLRVCLLDVHTQSLRSAEALCNAAGVTDRLLPRLCGDAAQLRLPRDLRVDLLLAELMQRRPTHEAHAPAGEAR